MTDRENMIRIFLMGIMLLGLTPNPATSRAGVISVGFNVILESRFGLTLGYDVIDNLGIELNYGGRGSSGMPSYGISLKLMTASDSNYLYMLFGYASCSRIGYYSSPFSLSDLDVDFHGQNIAANNHGFNLALGFEHKFKGSHWGMPFEFGGYMITRRELLFKKSYDFTREKFEIEKIVSKKWSLTPLLGIGVRLCSRRTN